MSSNLNLSEREEQTLKNLLALVEDATSVQDAFYLDEDSAERVSNLKQTVEEQTSEVPA